jgi:UDP-glucose 4-epimerase
MRHSAVLVTGGAGYIGSQMVHDLIDADERVVVLDNLSTGHRWAVPETAPLVIGETGNQALVSRLIREHDVETIIHFAASVVVPDSVRDPLGYYRNNTVHSRALIETAIGAASAISFSRRPARSTVIQRRFQLPRMRRRYQCRPTAGRS